MAKIGTHQNLAHIQDWCCEGPLHLMVLRLEGPCIFDKFGTHPGDDHDEPLSESEALSLLSDVLGGAAHLHGLSIIHRDLKPDNCLRANSSNSQAVLVDFGLAREMPAD